MTSPVYLPYLYTSWRCIVDRVPPVQRGCRCAGTVAGRVQVSYSGAESPFLHRTRTLSLYADWSTNANPNSIPLMSLVPNRDLISIEIFKERDICDKLFGQGNATVPYKLKVDVNSFNGDESHWNNDAICHHRFPLSLVHARMAWRFFGTKPYLNQRMDS